MSAYRALLPTKAIERVEAAGLADAPTVLADFAGAGLIKTYALVRVTAPAGQPQETIRDGVIPIEVWQRISEERRIPEMLGGGTVRLAGSGLIGGAPDVKITGVSISEGSLEKVLDRYCSQPDRALVEPNPVSAPKTNDTLMVAPSIHSETPESTKSPRPIRQGDLVASVAQAIQATGLGRTKINELMNDGTLVRKKTGRRTLITVESIERLVGTTVI